MGHKNFPLDTCQHLALDRLRSRRHRLAVGGDGNVGAAKIAASVLASAPNPLEGAQIARLARRQLDPDRMEGVVRVVGPRARRHLLIRRVALHSSGQNIAIE